MTIPLDYCFSLVPSYNDKWKKFQNHLSNIIGKNADDKYCMYYILGIINSEIGNLMLKRGKTPKGDYNIDYQVFEDLRIPFPTKEEGKNVRRLVQIVNDAVIGNSFDNKHQSSVDSIVFDLMKISPRDKKKIVKYCSLM
jgi:hypothetical protein